MEGLATAVAQVAAEMAEVADRGSVADYIPELAKCSAASFGISVVTCAGEEASAGDADEPFSIQSISKVFALALALDGDTEALWRRVGREPSGSAFNSIVQLEAEHGVPRNPFINAGALVIADIIAERLGADAVLHFIRACAGDPAIAVDKAVAASEAATGYRNAALANYMKAFGNLRRPVPVVLEAYFNQCAIAMSCRQLAHAARFLANAGLDPRTGAPVVSSEAARRINALMLTCGHYDASGEFAFQVGLPGKSGVGGGILAVVPGRATVAVWSPGLGPRGNSVVGATALHRLAAAMQWNVFNPDRCG